MVRRNKKEEKRTSGKKKGYINTYSGVSNILVVQGLRSDDSNLVGDGLLGGKIKSKGSLVLFHDGRRRSLHSICAKATLQAQPKKNRNLKTRKENFEEEK